MTMPRLTALVLTASLLAGLTGTAGAEDPADPEAAREEARRRHAALAGDLDVLHASEVELHAAAEALAAEVQAQEAEVAASERAVAVAESEVRQADARLAATRREIQRLTAQLVDRAVSSFIAPERSSLYDVAVSANFTDAARKQAFIGRVIADEAAMVDDLDGAKERLEREQDEAEAAEARSSRRRADNVDRLASLEAAAVEQARVQDAIEQRSSEVIAEIDALEATEAELTALIEQRAREQREAEERARAEAEAAAARAREQAEEAARQRAAVEAAARQRAAMEAAARQRAADEAAAQQRAADEAAAQQRAADEAAARQRAADESARQRAGAAPSERAAEAPQRSLAVPGTATGAGGCTWPVGGVVTSEYGSRWGRLHAGIDIAAPTGTTIHAARAGTVLVADEQGGYGLAVVIDHGDMATLYGHQSRIAVSVGERVAQGEVIGYVGNTGHSTGPHLHFETRSGGSPVNPRPCLP